jgi:hypothetical protein
MQDDPDLVARVRELAAAGMAQRGATVCPTVACVPINANEGFRR